MVVIRMKRAGAKKRPFYRVVVADSRSPRDGRYIEQLGYYDPLTDPATFKVDTDKFASWIRRGATPSESVGVMMAKHAPEALRPAPLITPEAAAAVTAPTKEERKTKKQEAKKAKEEFTKREERARMEEQLSAKEEEIRKELSAYLSETQEEEGSETSVLPEGAEGETIEAEDAGGEESNETEE